MHRPKNVSGCIPSCDGNEWRRGRRTLGTRSKRGIVDYALSNYYVTLSATSSACSRGRGLDSSSSKLPPKELAQFRDWFHKFDGEAWDKQFEEDARSGRLDDIADRALADFKKGKSTEL